MTGWALRHPGILNELHIYNGWVVVVKVVVDLLVRRWRELPQPWDIPPAVPAHFISQTHPSLFLSSQTCLVRKLGQDIARGKCLFS